MWTYPMLILINADCILLHYSMLYVLRCFVLYLRPHLVMQQLLNLLLYQQRSLYPLCHVSVPSCMAPTQSGTQQFEVFLRRSATQLLGELLANGCLVNCRSMSAVATVLQMCSPDVNSLPSRKLVSFMSFEASLATQTWPTFAV